MTFKIPNGYDRFANEVFARFRALLSKHVLGGITQLTLREWQSNFSSDEEQYLAAHLLDALIFRTDLMIDSTSQHVIEMLLPMLLREQGLFSPIDIDAFIVALSQGDSSLGLRFVAVDGNFELAPAKSGAQLIRQFYRATGVAKSLLLRPENINAVSNDVKVLIFLDDCLGTGRQFEKFCNAYDLSSLATRLTLIYIPFFAHPSGLNKLHKSHPFLQLAPVELLGEHSDFFSEHSSHPGVWARDRQNQVQDVKRFYSALMKRKGVPKESQYCLNLSLGFAFATPNNTLKAYFSDQGSWKRLLIR